MPEAFFSSFQATNASKSPKRRGFPLLSDFSPTRKKSFSVRSCMPNGLFFFILFFAALRCGALRKAANQATNPMHIFYLGSKRNVHLLCCLLLSSAHSTQSVQKGTRTFLSQEEKHSSFPLRDIVHASDIEGCGKIGGRGRKRRRRRRAIKNFFSSLIPRPSSASSRAFSGFFVPPPPFSSLPGDVP